jgi:hypothetical protein
MNFLGLIALVGLSWLIGYLWPLRLRRVDNPKPHPLADASYYLLDIDGEQHAFTFEQLEVARERFKRLEGGRSSFRLRRSWAVIAVGTIGAAILALLAAGCGPRTREERRPMPSASMTHAQAVAWAEAHWDAVVAGRAHRTVTDSGSMLPLFGSTSVLLTEPATDIRAGDIVIYGGRSIVHRVREVRDGNALVDGDNNKASDGWIPLASVRARVAGILYSKG